MYDMLMTVRQECYYQVDGNNAVMTMEAGPPKSVYRNWFQTTVCCCT
jgi:hypothetical protein